METEIPARLSTLGHPRRLAVFRLLMRRYPEKVPAGDLIDALDLKPSTLSAYLAALMQARLVTQVVFLGHSMDKSLIFSGVQ